MKTIIWSIMGPNPSKLHAFVLDKNNPCAWVALCYRGTIHTEPNKQPKACWTVKPPINLICKDCEKKTEKERVEKLKKFAEIFDANCKSVPGFHARFNKLFIEEAGKHPMGTVDTEALQARVLKELGR